MSSRTGIKKSGAKAAPQSYKAKYLSKTLVNKIYHFGGIYSKHPRKFAIEQTLCALHNSLVGAAELFSASGKLRSAVVQRAY